MLGSNVSSHPDFVLLLGGIILLVLFLVIWTNKHSPDFNETAVWYGLIIYGATVIAALTALRGNHFLIPELRHYTSTLFVLAGLLPLAYYYFSRSEKIKVQTKQSQNSRYIQLILLTLISCMMMLSGVFHLFTGIDAGYSWFNDNTNNANFHLSKVDYTVTTFGGVRFDGVFREDKNPQSYAYAKALLDIGIPPSIKYFEENQLNLYDPAQSFYFDGIWSDVRNLIFKGIAWRYSTSNREVNIDL
jgi:amino acid transporter